MSELTSYLHSSLKDNRIFRWPDKLMPLKIYVAPFHWYQKTKREESPLYNLFVSEALKIWSDATFGKFSYVFVNDYHQSNINITWRRVNRKSLGLCHMSGTKDYMMYSAEVEIGLSDGLIHQAYQDTNEVKHTIIHEMGHAIGLGHSPHYQDIMFVPHQYGQIVPSTRDLNTAKWLYSLDPGFEASPYMEDWGLDRNSSIDELIWVYEHQDQFYQGQQVPSADGDQGSEQQYSSSPDEAILTQQEILAYRNLYNISLQNIKVDLNNKKPVNTKIKNNNQPETPNKANNKNKKPEHNLFTKRKKQ
ncbi:MAG: SprT-like domain-containing protein [Cyanobacteriota bacterium]